VAGIQSSILISESFEGRRVACTRQNAGRSVSGWAGARPRPGATKDPAATVCAIVIVVLDNDSADRLPQVAPLDELRAA